MLLTLRHRAQAILRDAGWDLAPPPVIWSPRMARCAGLFVVEKDSRGKWHPEIRLNIPLLRRRDWPWPQQVCGMNCHAPEQVQLRILESETDTTSLIQLDFSSLFWLDPAQSDLDTPDNW